MTAGETRGLKCTSSSLTREAAVLKQNGLGNAKAILCAVAIALITA